MTTELSVEVYDGTVYLVARGPGYGRVVSMGAVTPKPLADPVTLVAEPVTHRAHGERHSGDDSLEETAVAAPEPAARPSQRRQLITLIVVVLALAVPIIYFWAFADGPDPKPQLCDMLRDGWTADEIVDSDQWREWPSSMSRLERSAAVLDEAGRSCPNLVGL